MDKQEQTNLPEVYNPALPTIRQIVDQYRVYLEACRALLDDDDYVTIRGQQFRKRTGWAKLRRAFSVTLDVIAEERFTLDDDTWGYKFLVKATLPDGRTETADGTCTSDEFAGSNIKPTEHNVRAKALTRAKNRATSDILGAGTVSADEIEDDELPPYANRRTAVGKSASPAHWIEKDENRRRFWAWCHDTLGLNNAEVLAALGVESVKDFPGTMHEAKATIEKWVEEQSAAASAARATNGSNVESG